MTKPSMRDQMPTCASFIDSLREAFGKEAIDGQIRNGMKRQPTFLASENGHQIGTRNIAVKSLVAWDAQGRSYTIDIPEGVSISDEQEIRSAALEKANARVFGPKGLIVLKQEIEGDNDGR